MVRQKLRIRFAKKGLLRFVGHRDLVRAMERLFRRAGLPLGMSEGFHPKPRMSFPLALAVGIEAEDEVMELELCEERTGAEVLDRLRAHTLAGLEFHAVDVLPAGSKKAQVQWADYEAVVPAELQQVAEAGVAHLMAQTSYIVKRPRKQREFDLRPGLRRLELTGATLRMRLDCHEAEASPSPREVLAAVGLDALAATGLIVRRSVRLTVAGGTSPADP